MREMMGHRASGVTDPGAQAGKLMDAAADAIRTLPHADQWEAYLAATYRSGARAAIAQLGLVATITKADTEDAPLDDHIDDNLTTTATIDTASGDMLDAINQDAQDYAAERAAEMVGMRRLPSGELVPNPNAEWVITDTTREAVQADVLTALTEGWSTDKLADELADSYAFSDARAEMIARTELALADVQGSLATYRESGVVVGKESILGSEHDTDDECDDAADMGVVDLDDDFGGLGDPPYHPNCVCDVLPVLSDDATDEQSDDT